MMRNILINSYKNYISTNLGIIDNPKTLVPNNLSDSTIFIWSFQDYIWIDAFCFNYLWLFSGITRDNFDGKKVLRLEYEAYKPMAKKKMKEMCDSIRKQWEIHSIAMIHRIK